MPRTLLSFCILLFLYQFYSVTAQSCQLLTDATCSKITPVGTMVFVPAGVDFEKVQRDTNKHINVLNQGLLGEPCRSYTIQSLCSTNLRPCHTLPNGTAIPVPQEPCQEVCTQMYTYCYPIFGTDPTFVFGAGMYYPPGFSPPINCSIDYKDNAFNNGTFYQNGSAMIEFEGTNYTVPCSRDKPLSIPVGIYCNDPLVYGTNRVGKEACVLPCPLPSLTDSQYDAAKIMQGVLGWISWVLSAILIIALAVYPKARDFPRNLIIMTAFAANIAAGGITLPTYAGYDNVWCGGSDTTFIPTFTFLGLDATNNYVPKIQYEFSLSDLTAESSACTFQGAIIQFGFLAAVFWWTIIAFNMSLELFFKRLLPLDKTLLKWTRFTIYLFIGWGIPFLLMVIPASAGKIQYLPGDTYCFVTNEDDYAWSLPFWFIPVGLCLLFGVILFISALIRMTILFVTIKKIKHLLLLYLRLSIFILLYLILIVFIFAYTIQYATNESEINSGYEDYYACLILTNGQGCHLSDSITNYDLVMLKGWAISSLGYLLFFNFISLDVIVFWYRLFKTIGLVIIKRESTEVQLLRHMLVSRIGSSTRTTAMKSDSLSVTHNMEEPFEEDDEEEDEDGTQMEESSSSGSE